jgi:heme exporter protein CcmD
MSYGLYIFSAYAVTFVGLAAILLRAHSRYKKVKRELGKAKARKMK